MKINLNKRPVQKKNRFKGHLFILIEQLNYLEAYSESLETPKFTPMIRCRSCKNVIQGSQIEFTRMSYLRVHLRIYKNCVV